MGKYELLCLENPLLDIQGVADDSLLQKYDLKANDAILVDDSPARKHDAIFEELIQNHNAKLIPGGAAQNTARGAAYVLPADSVVYIGCVGKDKYAEILERGSREQGVKTAYLYDEKTPTGRCGVVITGHNRSLVTDLGAANNYKIEHLKSPEIWSLVEQAQHFYVGGYHLTVCTDAIDALGKEAAAKNKTFTLSISAPFIADFFGSQLAAVLPYTDYVIGNETEAEHYATQAQLSNNEIPDSKDLHAIARHIALRPKANTQRQRTAIITHGTEPTVVAVAKGNGEVEIKEYPVHAIDKSQINDTNGAGDAFAGGFMAGVVQGKSLEESVHIGQWLAKLSIQELGPSYPQPKQTYDPSAL